MQSRKLLVAPESSSVRLSLPKAFSGSHLLKEGLASSDISSTDQPCGGNRVHASNVPCIQHSHIEGGTFIPVLPSQGYVERGADALSTRNRGVPPLQATNQILTSTSGSTGTFSAVRRSAAVADGVEGLQMAATGLLARHVLQLDNRHPSRANGKDFFSHTVDYPESGDETVLDDRITPAMLHILLRKGRRAAARLVTLPAPKQTAVSFANAQKRRNSLAKTNSPVVKADPTRVVSRTMKPQGGRKPADCSRGARPPSGSTQVERDSGGCTRCVPNHNVATNGDAGTQKKVGMDLAVGASALLLASIENELGVSEGRGGTTRIARLQNDIFLRESPGVTCAHSALFSHALETSENNTMHSTLSVPRKVVEHQEPRRGTDPVCRNVQTNAILPTEPVAHCRRQTSLSIPGGSNGVTPSDAVGHCAGTVAHDGQRHFSSPCNQRRVGTVNTTSPVATDEVLGCLYGTTQEIRDTPSNYHLKYSFSAMCAGDDGKLVEELVRHYGEVEMSRRQARQRDKRTGNGGMVQVPTTRTLEAIACSEYEPHIQLCIGAASGGSDVPVFSALEAVLMVSREYEKIRQRVSHEPVLDSATIAEERRSAIRRLTSFDSTHIPEDYWVTMTSHLSQSSGTKTDSRGENLTTISSVEGVPGENFTVPRLATLASIVPQASKSSHVSLREGTERNSVLFPATEPVGRSQVYFLADVLDRMLNWDTSLLGVLSDPDIAYRILPPSYRASARNDSISRNPLLSHELQRLSTESYESYTTASAAVLGIVNMGMVELVRQVSCHCVERGALLDSLRQTLVDVTTSCIRVVAYSKQRAFDEAQKCEDMRRRLEERDEALAGAQSEAVSLQRQITNLQDANATLTLKASRMDNLMARVEAKRRRFEIHSEEIHESLLRELETELIEAVGDAFATLYQENERSAQLCADITAEAPSVAEARQRSIEYKSATDSLYSQSYQLLTTLSEATIAMNAACASLYDNVVLYDAAAQSKVASSRWVEIARAVGAVERKRKHRERVYETFCEWREMCQRGEKGKSPSDMDDFIPLCANGEYDTNTARELFDDVSDNHGPSMMGGSDNPQTHSAGDVNGDGNEFHVLSQPDGQRQRTANAHGIQYITTADLERIGARDCLPEEINAMFKPDFDFKAYMQLKWEPQETKFTLNLSDISSMLEDVQGTIKEMTLRMNALAKSAIIQKGSEPSMPPPAHPEDPCKLCGRKDTAFEEKTRRQNMMKHLSQEVQRRYDELMEKCQNAEVDREDARGTVRRLRDELDHAESREAELLRKISELEENNKAFQIPENSMEAAPPKSMARPPRHGGPPPVGRFKKGGATGGRRNRSGADSIQTKPLSGAKLKAHESESVASIEGLVEMGSIGSHSLNSISTCSTLSPQLLGVGDRPPA